MEFAFINPVFLKTVNQVGKKETKYITFKNKMNVAIVLYQFGRDNIVRDMSQRPWSRRTLN